MDYHDFIGDMTNLNANIGSDLFSQFGGILRCTECGEEHTLSSLLAGKYLANGWPKHCGYTMRWVTDRELAAENTASK
jgi:hypothetical protein